MEASNVASRVQRGMIGLREEFKLSRPALIFGFSLYWAWILAVPILYCTQPIAAGPLSGLPLSVAGYVARGCALVLVIALFRAKAPLALCRAASCAGPAAGAAGFLLMIGALGAEGPAGSALTAFAWALMGIADGLLVVGWLSVYRTLNLRSAVFSLFASMITAVAAMVVLGHIAGPLDVALAALAPVGCGLLLGRELKDAAVTEALGSVRSVEQSSSAAPRGLIGIYGAIVVFGMVFGGMQAIMLNFHHSPIPFTLRCLGICIGSVLALLVSIAPESSRSLIIYRIALPLMACGLLLVPLLDDDLFAAIVLVNTGFFLFDFLSIIMLIRATTLHQLSVVDVMATGRCANALGIFCGWIAGHLIANTLHLGSADISAWSSILLLALIVACGWLMGPSKIDEETPANQAQQGSGPANGEAQAYTHRWKRQCDLVATRYGLSPREREVMTLLSRGRDADYIATVFVISPHTAKTHIHNVYKKLDVHSQQDLISLVEQAATELVNN